MRSNSRLEIFDEFIEGDACLTDYGFERFRMNRFVVWNGNAEISFYHSDVRALLFLEFEAEPPESFDCFGARDVARKFHADFKTGSSTKCNRMERGTSGSSK